MRAQDLSIYRMAVRTKDGRQSPEPVLETQSCPDTTSGLSCPDASSSPDTTLFWQEVVYQVFGVHGALAGDEMSHLCEAVDYYP